MSRERAIHTNMKVCAPLISQYILYLYDLLILVLDVVQQKIHSKVFSGRINHIERILNIVDNFSLHLTNLTKHITTKVCYN
jgi:flagellin-specific chaperone FliS